MSTKPPPAFQFYPADWLSDARVREMTFEEKGVYIDLLSHAWKERGIPADQKRLAKLLGLSPAKLARLWATVGRCWEERGDVLVQPRMERQRDERERHREQAREAGKRSAEKRRSGNGGATALALLVALSVGGSVDLPLERNGNSSSTSSSSSLTPPARPTSSRNATVAPPLRAAELAWSGGSVGGGIG